MTTYRGDFGERVQYDRTPLRGESAGEPAWERTTTTGPRKVWADADVPPPGEGWERDLDAGDGGWDRDDYHETSFWRRRIPEAEECM